MRQNKILSLISVAVLILQTVVSASLMVLILQLNMLPDRYSVLLLGFLGALFVLTALLLLVRGRKGVRLVRRVAAWFIAALTIAGCGALLYVLFQLQNTMQAVTNVPVSADTRDVYVLTEDPAQVLEDAAGYTFGIVDGYDVENTQKALDAIGSELGLTVKTTGFETVFAMVDGLYDGRVGAVILNSAYITILEEYPDYAGFEGKTRLLYEAPLEVPEPTQTVATEPEPTQPAEPADVTNTPFVVYISGSDTRSKLLSKSRSDVNILAVVNPNSHEILLLNTPRDYYVENPAGGGAMDKLTHCGIYGIDCSVKALEGLYGISVDHYAQINFTGFKTMIDAVGGVTVYADESFSAAEGYYFQKGENYLDGEAALSFARERYHVSGGDRGRGKNQMKVITAVIEKLTSGTAILSGYSGILESLEGMFTTSFPAEDISKLVKQQLEEMPGWQIHSFAVTGRTGSDVNYSMPGLKASVMYQNKAYIERASLLVEKVMKGEHLTAEDLVVAE